MILPDKKERVDFECGEYKIIVIGTENHFAERIGYGQFPG